MSTIIAFLGVLAFFPMIACPFLAYGYFREGNATAGMKASAVFALCIILVMLARDPKGVSVGEWRDCYTDWDGFSNPTVCE